MKQFLGRIYLRAFGWTHTGPLPDVKKCVVIAAPHTSNWDGAHMVAICWALGLKMNWMAKHTLFRPPLGWLVRRLGAVPIDRRAPQGLVQQMAELFEKREFLWLAVPPEGTRGLTKFWKSGFYAIAHEAKVPVLLGFLDFENKKGGIGACIEITGDPRADMDKIREFYAGMKGHRPELQGPIQLRAEGDNVWPPGSNKATEPVESEPAPADESPQKPAKAAS